VSTEQDDRADDVELIKRSVQEEYEDYLSFEQNKLVVRDLHINVDARDLPSGQQIRDTLQGRVKTLEVGYTVPALRPAKLSILGRILKMLSWIARQFAKLKR